MSSTTPQNTMQALIRNACFSADGAALQARMLGATPATVTRAALAAAIEALEANGLITITPIEQWPDFYVPDPPYGMPGVQP